MKSDGRLKTTESKLRKGMSHEPADTTTEQHGGQVKAEALSTVLILRLRQYPEDAEKSEGKKRKSKHCIPVAQVGRDLFQLYFQRHKLT